MTASLLICFPGSGAAHHLRGSVLVPMSLDDFVILSYTLVIVQHLRGVLPET